MSSPSAERVTVLIGAAGTTTAFGIVRSLRSHWPGSVRILAADTNQRRLVASAALADDFLQSPPVGDPGYAAWLEQAIAASGADLYVPLLDADVVAAAALAEGGRTAGARVAAPSLDSAGICCDKLATYEWLRDRGLPACETWEPAAAPRRSEGLVAKSRRGQGSVGFRELHGLEELEALGADEDVVVQPSCGPPEVTIDAFLSGDGEIFRAVCRERLEVKAGVSTKARVFESDELAEVAEAIARGLGLVGGSCVQVMGGADGEWRVTDVNARPGAGTPLSTAAGVDVLGAACAELLGRCFDYERALARLPHEVLVVRQLHEYVVD
jgi:carbamoylphosphate synthase large subunit